MRSFYKNEAYLKTVPVLPAANFSLQKAFCEPHIHLERKTFHPSTGSGLPVPLLWATTNGAETHFLQILPYPLADMSGVCPPHANGVSRVSG